MYTGGKGGRVDMLKLVRAADKEMNEQTSFGRTHGIVHGYCSKTRLQRDMIFAVSVDFRVHRKIS